MADTDATAEWLTRVMYEDWPITVSSPALAEATGLPMGAAIPLDLLLAKGGDVSGLRRSAKAAANAVADKLRPAVEVWRDAAYAWINAPLPDTAAAAVIEADRAQCMAALQAHADALAGAFKRLIEHTAQVERHVPSLQVDGVFGGETLELEAARSAYEAFKAASHDCGKERGDGNI